MTNSELAAAAAVDLGNTPKTVIAYPYTGDERIDVLLPDAQSQWRPDLPAGQSRTVTYSFALSPAYLAGADYADDRKGLTPFNAAEKTAARSLFSYISSILPIQFVEIVESASSNSPVGDIRLVNNNQDSAGYAIYPNDVDKQYRGDVFLANSALSSTFAPGSYEYDTLLHEITHALGLKHPGNYNAGSAPSTDPGNYLASAVDSKTLSVVSYAEQAQGLQRIDFAPYDLLALKYLYGLKPQNTGDDVYTWTDRMGNQLQTLVDDGGHDTLDLKLLSTANTVDLREGHSSSAGITGSSADVPGVAAVLNVQIAFGTVIEDVLGSDQADELIGNASNNLFQGRGGNDILDGGDGLDTAVWSGQAAQYTVRIGPEGCTVQSQQSNEGTDELVHVERLRFQDQSLALDLQAGAGTVAKILGAVFGPAAVLNKQFVGIGLHYLDDLGMSYSGLMQLAIEARLGANPSSAQVVDLLYSNLVGQMPDAVTRKSYTDLLDKHIYSVASLGILAADTDINKDNIHLMGLSQTGLAYLPVGA